MEKLSHQTAVKQQIITGLNILSVKRFKGKAFETLLRPKWKWVLTWSEIMEI
jgi:hypothetical protein